MMWIRFWLLALLVLSSGLNAHEFQVFEKRHADSFVNEEELSLIQPYLIQDTHHLKSALDTIFARGGVLASIETMEKAGFKILLHRKGRGLVVAKHPLLKDHLIKTYLDTATHVDWPSWVRRAKGARFVQACMDAKPSCARYVKVPKKWIFHIPLEVRGAITAENLPREFVLLVEDMRVVSKERNVDLYKKSFSKKFLHALYYVIKKSGYSDGHITNLPFSTDGKIAFIDTEFTNTWPVHPEWLTKYFCQEDQVYWKSLITKP